MQGHDVQRRLPLLGLPEQLRQRRSVYRDGTGLTVQSGECACDRVRQRKR